MNDEPDNPNPPPRWLVYLIVALGVGLLIYALASEFPGRLEDDWTGPRLTYLVILLVVVGSSAIVGLRMRAGTMLRHTLIWTAIGALLILAYSFRGEVRGLGNRIVGELRPDRALVEGDGTVTVRRGRDGHFRLTATVDGNDIRFLVDTGATVVALTPDAARAAGFDPDRLTYGMPVATANGVARSAPVTLGEIRVGPIGARDVRAAVIREGLGESLLGLSFLDRLSGYEVRRDTMILKP